MDGRVIAVTALAILFASCGDSTVGPNGVQVTIDPSRVEVEAGSVQSFSAALSGAADAAVMWRVSNGEIVNSTSELLEWRAPLVPGTYTVTAVSMADTMARATATVDVSPPAAAVTLDLSDYRGTAATLPDGLFVTGEDLTGVAVGTGFDPFTGVHDLSARVAPSFDGFGAFTNGSGHYSFGIRERGETGLRDSRLFLAYHNDSDRTIVAFHVEYDVEVWRLGKRANRIRLKFGLDTGGYGALPDLASSVNPRGAASGGDVGRIVDGTLEENRTRASVRIDLAVLPGREGNLIGSLAPGETGYFRWQYSNADGDDGPERSALALANILIVPVFAEVDQPDPPTGEPSAPPLSFSHDAGFYAEPFALELASGLDDATIYYTIDGSEPNPARVIGDEGWAATPIEKQARTFVYEGPIDLTAAQARPAVIAYIPTTSSDWKDIPWREPAGEIQTAVVVRAVAIHDGEPVATKTRTYLVTPEGRDRYTLPVVSLATDRDGLFGAERGIYIHGAEGYNDLGRGREWERVAHLEYFERSGRRPLAQRVGLRIHGGYTRKMAKKSLRVYARGEYGESRLRHAFFDGKSTDDFKRLILRSSGNEQIHSLMRDATAHTLVEHLAFDTQHYSPVIVFLNGEYWGIHNLRDRFDEHYLETHHGVLRDRVVVLKNGRLNVGEPGDAAAYDELLKLARAGRLRTRADFDAWIDLDGFLDYIVAQMYVANNDWPHNNIRWWRYTGAPDPVPGPRDGRWRWMMYDVDRSFGYATDAHTDMVRHLLESRDPDYSRGFILDMLRVVEIRHELIQRIAVHLATTFEPGRVRGHIQALAAAIRPEIDENFARWAPQRGRAYWESQITTLLDFASERPARFREHVVAYFKEVTGTAELEISGLGGDGTVRLYTIPLEPGWPGVEIVGGTWRGELFTGVPVVLSAEGVDLSRARLSGNVKRVEAARDALRFIMTGPVRVEVR